MVCHVFVSFVFLLVCSERGRVGRWRVVMIAFVVVFMCSELVFLVIERIGL